MRRFSDARTRGRQSGREGAQVAASEQGRYVSRMPVGRRVAYARMATFVLVGAGLLLGICYLGAYPLFARTLPGSAVTRALLAEWPWLPHFFWTERLPFLLPLLARVSWFDLHTASTGAVSNVLLMLCGIASGLYMCAVAVCGREGLEKRYTRLLVVLICAFSLLFGVLALGFPGDMSNTALRYALADRVVLLYHSNPYVVQTGLLARDSLYQALPAGTDMSVF